MEQAWLDQDEHVVGRPRKKKTGSLYQRGRGGKGGRGERGGYSHLTHECEFNKGVRKNILWGDRRREKKEKSEGFSCGTHIRRNQCMRRGRGKRLCKETGEEREKVEKG